LAALFLTALVSMVGIASAEKPGYVELGGLLPVVVGGFSPKALPRRGKPAPIALNLSGKIETTDGGIPAALREVVLELDRNVTVDPKGTAVCRLGNIDSPPPTERCRPALVGKGWISVLVAIPEQAPFTAKSRLLAFNEGVKRGKTTVLIYGYLAAPVSASFVIAVEVAKIDERRYGTRWRLTFPKFVGGYGSVTKFNLTISRRFQYEGEKQSYLLAKCPDGHLDGHASSLFADGSEGSDSFVRSCVPKS
jgi:hypothetical protein